LVTTGDATGTISVSGIGLYIRIVTISDITGEGTVRLIIDPGTASGDLGALAPGAEAADTFGVDDTAISLSVGPPSVPVTQNAPVSYTLTYYNAATVTLSLTDVTVIATGDAAGTAAVAGTGTSERTVTISDISGDGTLGISVSAGTAEDASSNPAPAAGPSAPVTVDNTPPEIALIGQQYVYVKIDTAYTDAGAVATDNVDGDLTSGIVVVNNVNTSELGDYTVTYDVADSAGNSAVQAVRTVSVVEQLPAPLAAWPLLTAYAVAAVLVIRKLRRYRNYRA
jgi:hypothetical protein